MKKNLSLLIALGFYLLAFSQVQHGGTPKSMQFKSFLNEANEFVSPQTNVAALRQEDEIIDQIKDIPWRYGFIHYVDVKYQDGSIYEMANGDRIWRIQVKSTGAQTINLTFKDFKLAPGAEMFIYTENYEQILGSFTHENNLEHGYLTTDLLHGEEVSIELYEPAATVGQNLFVLERIVHGYRALDYKKKYIGDSGSCNNNVICAVGDNWRDQIRSVGILLQQNNLSAGFCTGALINNTCNDGKAYFLTANHCSADATSVVGFNFESTQCNTNAGPYLQNTISGMTLKANNAGSDFALHELSSVPPASYNVYYSGWDRTGTTTNGQVGIHHPAGDVKKITFDNQAATYGTYSGAQCWRIGNWEDGTTEGGSSGSPLFNLNGNIIGQLYGGSASCQSITEDFYGRFDISWDGGSSAADELKTWLDPCGTGQTVLAGYDPNAIVANEDVALTFSGGSLDNVCAEKIEQKITLRNRGIQDVTSVSFNYGVNGLYSNYSWTGTLASNQSVSITLDSLDLSTGTYAYEAFIVASSLSADENLFNDSVSFSIDIENGLSVQVSLTTNFEAGQNSFEILDANNNQVAFEDNFGANETYNFTYCLPAGNTYCINIYDEGGDGLSPTFFFDQGNYTLIVNGEEIYNDDEIGEGYEYCVEAGPNSIKNINERIVLQIVPNPNDGNFQVQSNVSIDNVQIISVLGSIVQEWNVNQDVALIQAQNLTKGSYFVKIFTKEGVAVKKMMVK
jgi:lysyl endopeptidase